jgi:Ca2+-binding EF-hand superfamily protein
MSKASVTVPPVDPSVVQASCQGFALYDKGNKGKLERKEFAQFVQDTFPGGLHPNLFDIVDSDHNGSISFMEFLTWSKAVARGPQSWLKLVFDSCDIGRKGKLSKSEFMQFLNYNNVAVSFFEKTATFKKFDTDGNGSVDFDECQAIFDVGK